MLVQGPLRVGVFRKPEQATSQDEETEGSAAVETLRAGRSANKPITRGHILHPAQIVVGLTSSAHLNG